MEGCCAMPVQTGPEHDRIVELEREVSDLRARLSSSPGSDAGFRSLLECAPDAMVIVNKAGEIVLVNSQTEYLFGYSREELLGHSVEILVPNRFGRKHPDLRTGYFHEPRVRPMGKGVELFGLRKDRTEF